MKYTMTVLGILLPPMIAAPTLAQAQAIHVVVEGMHCEGCATTVKASLEALPEVKEASVDVPAGMAYVAVRDVNAQPDDEALRRAVEKAGYKPVRVFR